MFWRIYATSIRTARVQDQGVTPMSASPTACDPCRVLRYLLHHRHDSEECGVVFASFRGHESPLRHEATIGSCHSGGHALWWTVEAASEADALALLPFFVAERTTATRVSEVEIP
jgi:hypothetical protein